MRLSLILISAATIAGTAFAATANEADRRAAMKQAGGAAKAISGGTDVAANAQLMADIAARIPALFEANEISSTSKARPEIWANWADFTAKAQGLEAAAQAVLAAANSGGDVAGAARAMGGACGACHKSYKLN